MSGTAALGLAGSFAIYQLVKVALLPTGRCFLKEQRETALIKFLEEFVPVDVL